MTPQVLNRDDLTGAVAYIPATVRINTRLSLDELTQKARQMALDPAIFDTYPPFFWEAIISNNTLDAYYTRMSKQTLDNFAEDARKGVSFLDSHNHMRLGLGRSIDGYKLEEGASVPDFPTDKLITVGASFYTMQGYVPGASSITADMFIVGVKGGAIFDVSVGFLPKTLRCSICGEELWSWDCWHIPGEVYEIKGEDAEVVRREIAFFWVEDARLVEVSAVYDGATPGAAITGIVPLDKAVLEAEAGRISPARLPLLEARFRSRLPQIARSFAGVTIPQGGLRMSGTRTTNTELEKLVREQQAAADGGDAPATPPPADTPAPEGEGEGEGDGDGEDETLDLDAPLEDPTEEAGDTTTDTPSTNASPSVRERQMEGMIRELRTILAPAGLGAPMGQNLLERATWAMAEIRRLQPLAEDGLTWRETLIDETLAEGRRAYGQDFKESAFKPMLERATIDEIRGILATFQAAGDARFPGGRKTRENAHKGEGGEEGTVTEPVSPAHTRI